MRDQAFAIYICFFLAEAGRAIHFVTVTWMIYYETEDPLVLGSLVGFGFLPSVLLIPWIGVIVDRWIRKRLVIIALLTSSGGMAVFLGVILLDHMQIGWIIGCHMLIQVAGSLFRPAIQAFVAEQFQVKELPVIYSRSSALGILGGLLGATAGGLMTGYLGVVVSAMVAACCFLAAVIVIQKLRENNGERKGIPTSEAAWRSLFNGFLYVSRDRLMIPLLVFMFHGQLVFHTSIGFLAAYTMEVLQQSAIVHGWLDATIALGGAAAGMAGAWWWRQAKHHVVTHSFFIIVLGLTIVFFSSSFYSAMIGLFLIGAGTTWVRVLLQSVQQMATDRAYHGRLASLRMLLNQGAVTISAPVFGFVAAQAGVEFIYGILTVPVVFCIVYGWVLSRKQRFKRLIEMAA
ncbi:MFS transporter [Halalkalibacterium halodurans]|uniref:MFS transporter n=1 Tax=Halalkalibacterium halodurans TaxID=86665 RepID=UPI002E20A0AF|nr:MFS transporter [Halalkalibacterium halodurans]